MLRTGLALAILTAAAAVARPSDTALANCSPGRSPSAGNYHDGYIRAGNSTSGYPGGVQSSILEYAPYVAGTSASTAWTMLEVGSNPTGAYAQVGWVAFGNGQGGSTRHTFDEYTHDGTYTEDNFPPQSVGSYTTYETFFQYGTPSTFIFSVNGSQVNRVGAAFTPDTAYVSGEVTNLATQMPGSTSSSDHEVFSSTQWFVHNAWYGLDGSGKNEDPASNGFGQVKSSTTYYAIWDKQCSS